MGVKVTLAGQNITAFTDELSLDIESNLGQGPGVPQGASGRATTCKFLTLLGPQGGNSQAPAVPQTVNLLTAQQADVETNDLSGFKKGSTVTISLDTTQAWHGSGSLKVVTSGGANTFESVSTATPSNKFLPNATYTFSAYMKASTGTPTIRFYCQANDLISGNTSIGTVGNVTLSTTWTRYSFTVTMPASMSHGGFGFVYLGLRADTGGTAQAITFWMDGMQVEAGATATAWHITTPGLPPGPLGAGQTIPNFNSPNNQIPDSQVDAYNGVSGYTGSNGTLAQGPEATPDWSQNGASAKLTTAATGDNYILVNGTVTLGILTNAWPVQGSTTYTYSAWVRGDGTSLPTLRVVQLDINGNTISDTHYTTPGSSPATWVQQAMTFTTASNCVGVLLRVTNQAQSSLCTYYASAFQFIQASAPEAWNPPALVRQGEVIIYDANGNRIFGGFATDFQDKTEYTKVKTQITASDYWQSLARIVINQIYTSQFDNQILLNLFQTYAPTIDLSAWSQTQTYLFTKIYLRAKTLQDSIQRIADTVGFDTWIDAYKKFHYQSPTTSGTAPFSLSDTPDFHSSFPCAVTSYERDDTAIINRVYFYGGKTPSADFTQDLSAQANGTTNTFVLAYYPREASDGKIHFFIGGVEKALGRVFNTGAANTLKQNGGTADALLNSSAQAITVDSSEIPAAGTSVSCKYRYEIPLTVQVTNQQSFQYYGNFYDGVISDTTVQDKTTAIQRARVLLLEQAYGFEHITIQHWQPGLVAGMLLRIDHNIRNIHNTYIVQSVKLAPLGQGQFTYTAEVGAWNWNLVDILVQAGKQGNLIDQTDDESQDVVTAMQLFQNLSVHIVWNTPITRTSGGYFARATPVGDGHDAYPGLFTITS